MSGATMLYPAPSLAGFFAAVLTHAAIVQGVRASEISAKQAEADKVLEPHSNVLTRMSSQALIESSSKRLTITTLERGRGLVVEIVPQYSLSSDRRVIVLDNAIRIRNASKSNTSVFENTVRVVSRPCDADDPLAHWSANDGQALIDESAAMLAHSVEIALMPSQNERNIAARTQRYRFGASQKMERGQVVAELCGRVVLRTLRDWLMSVPTETTGDAERCTVSYAMNAADR